MTPETSPPSQTPEDRWNTALHEAGHAVAALAFEYRIERLTIIPEKVKGGWYLGRITITTGKPGHRELWTCPNETARRYFVYFFAGTAAEQLFSPHPNPDAWDHASASPLADVAYCREWMEARAGDTSLEWYSATIRAQTEAWLQPRRWKVEAIARALLREKTMDRQAILSASVIALICRGSTK